MLRRPKPGETDEDLENQALQFLNQENFTPAAKTVRLNKRKNDESGNLQGSTKPKSRFAQNRIKKAKEGLVDNTVIEEVLVRKEKIASCTVGRIVARDVPDIGPIINNDPDSSRLLPNPKPITIKSLSDDRVDKLMAQGIQKSLYKLQWEDEHPQEDHENNVPVDTSAPVAVIGKHLQEPGKESDSGEEYDNSQDEGQMPKFESMTHEEKLAKQKELLERLSPEQVEFLRNFRKNKVPRPMEVECSDTIEKEAMEISSNDSTRKVKFDDVVDIKEIPSNDSILDTLPINPQQAKMWVNMDKVEIDKLKWMTNVPNIKPLKDGEGHTARFSFEGDLLPYDADVHWRQGLHHHGEEPERAGYTLDELFVLSRSQVIQQRHIGLRTIANILRNAKEGLYDECFESPILQLMVDAGVVLILRFSLDETSTLVYQEAIRGLYYLVVSEGDERCLDLLDPWVPCGVQPGMSSCTYANEQDRAELQEEERDLKDVDVIKLDIIRALIRMDCHIRFRFMLETIKPSPQSVIYILGIMTRIVRHSLTAAWTLANTPRLIQSIIENFLPCNLSSLMTGVPVSQIHDVYGVPLWQALRLFRIWASCGRQLAGLLVHNDVLKHLSTFISIEPSDISMPIQDSLLLAQEAYGLWRVLLRYGLTKAVEEFKSSHSVFVRQLLFYRDKVSVNVNIVENKYNYDVGAQMIDTVTQIYNVAATTSLLTAKMTQNQATVFSDGKAIVIPPPPITWEELADFYDIIERCFKKWLTEATRLETLSYSGLRLIGSCCEFFNVFFAKWKNQTSFNRVECLNKIKDLNTIVNNFASSSTLSNLVKILPNHSALTSKFDTGTLRDPKNLGSLGCITFKGKVTPIMQETSPFPLLYPLTNLMLTLFNANPSLDNRYIKDMVDSGQFVFYLASLNGTHSKLSSQWITRVEVYTLSNICLLASAVGVQHNKLINEVAIFLLSCIHNGDEHLIKTLLTQVICNVDLVTDMDDVSTIVQSLGLKDWEPLRSPAIKQPTLSVTQLNQNMKDSLPSISTIISKNLVSFKQYEYSNVLKSFIPFLTNSLMIDDSDNQLVTDAYYSLLPLKRLMAVKYDKMVSQRDQCPEFESDASCPEIILLTKRCLQLTYFFLKFRRNAILSKTNVTGWIRHLGLTFLAANDLFLDPDINSYLQACLIELLRNDGYSKIDCNLRFNGLTSCYTWYKQLLEQFLGVSYGDLTFALFILLPVQQYMPTEYRKLLWGDLCDALPLIRLSVENLQSFIPLEQFLNPPEVRKEFFGLYKESFTLGVNEIRTPVLYKIASHHIKHLNKPE